MSLRPAFWFLIGACLVGISTPISGEPLFVPTTPLLDQDNNIRNYLMKSAGEITLHSLAGIDSLDQWKSIRELRYPQFLEMMSLTDVPMQGERPPLNVKIVGTLQQKGYRIVKLYYESLPHLYVRADLYIPDGISKPVPAILYVCGHSRTQKVHYQAHPRKFAQLGFVCLIIETIQWGEVQGHHWGCYSEGRFNWYSRGYTPGGVEMWNSIRGLDLLCTLPEVDKDHLGITGISGGGAYTWYVAAGDPRIQAAAPVCGTSTLEGHINQRTIDGHCDCMEPINTYRWDCQDMGALIAPKPLLIASANGDGLFSIESIRQCYENIKKIYALYNAADRVSLVETPGGHSYHEKSRTQIFSFFLKHLMGKEVPPEQVGDIDESESAMLSQDQLRIFANGMLPDDRTQTIQDTFQKMADFPNIQNNDDLQNHRKKVIEFLKEKTFGAFPQNPPDLSLRLVFRDQEGKAGEQTYSFVPEAGYRLKMDCRWQEPPSVKRPVLLVLRSPNENRWESEGFASNLIKGWSQAFLEVRGVGETGWSPELQWHIRRAAAWTGRTIASMRVYDVLRCLQALRTMEGVDPDKIALAARGEMSAVALYAALLDGKVQSVMVQNPPPTQNVESAKDGRGEAIEMLNCLRITDLPQIAGILWPTKVVFIGKPDAHYDWSLQTAKALGHPEGVIINE